MAKTSPSPNGRTPAALRALLAGSRPLHLHRHDDEIWYVLEGVLHVRVGAEVFEARAGSAVLAPRGTPHTYWNPGPGLTRYLLVMTSNVYSLIRDIHAMTERSPAALRAVFENHDSELVNERRSALPGLSPLE